MSQTNANPAATLEIDALSYGPYGIGRLDGKAVMIPHTAPGDTVEARIVETKERYAVGQAVRIVTPSPVRQTPPCPYVPACGGCTWQHIQYAAQLKAKQQNVDDMLRRIGKLEGYELRPIIPSPFEYQYRRRIRLQVSPSRKLGYYGAASHQIVAIDSCLIGDERLNGAIAVTERWLSSVRTAIKEVEIVCGEEPGEIVVLAHATGELVPGDQTACEAFVHGSGAPQGLIIGGKGLRNAWGRATITLRLTAELALKVDADVFIQVNPDANRVLLAELINAADFQANDRALELYCGAGNFTLAIAQRTREVVAVEGDRHSIANAKLNAQRNGLENIRWICSAVPAALAQLQKRKEKFTKIVLDPPRAGAKGLEADLAALGAKRMIYVSCDPTTLARDLAALAKLGYRTKLVQPIDLFPQTYHVETLAVVERFDATD
jgi:23S rRNA (uracil1939-C5)-methyltransferase